MVNSKISNQYFVRHKWWIRVYSLFVGWLEMLGTEPRALFPSYIHTVFFTFNIRVESSDTVCWHCPPLSLFSIILVSIVFFLCDILCFLWGSMNSLVDFRFFFLLRWNTSRVLRTKVHSDKHPSSTVPAPLGPILWTAVRRAWPTEVINL